MAAVTSLFLVAIPIVYVVFGVFPFVPNRWFGVGFAAYYCLCTLLLYQVSSVARESWSSLIINL